MRISTRRLHLSPEIRQEVTRSIAVSSEPAATFYLLVILSTTIAAYGLLADSTAVVIGAMLVAPLMGPIFGIALGLTGNDRRLLVNATVSEALGAGLAIALAALLGLLSPHPDFGREILSRTAPTLYDLIIAFASGLAGAYAVVNPRLSPTLPGVAISTALVPPLTTVGLCLSIGAFDLALGGLTLFIANLLAIEIAASAIFFLFGFGDVGRQAERSIGQLIGRFGVRIVLLALVTVYLGRALVRFVDDRLYDRRLRSIVAEQVGTIAGARLSDLSFSRGDDTTSVFAVVLTPREFGPQQVGQIADVIRGELDPHVRLVIRSLSARDVDRSGIVFATSDDARRDSSAAASARFLEETSGQLREALASVPGAELADIIRRPNGDRVTLLVVVRAPTAVDPQRVAEMERRLRERNPAIDHLIVRTVLTRDADALRYLYDERADTLSPAERLVRDSIIAVVSGGLADLPAMRIEEVRMRRSDSLRVVDIDVRGPSVVTPARVALIEQRLRNEVDSTTSLAIRSVVDAVATPNGYR